MSAKVMVGEEWLCRHLDALTPLIAIMKGTPKQAGLSRNFFKLTMLAEILIAEDNLAGRKACVRGTASDSGRNLLCASQESAHVGRKT